MFRLTLVWATIVPCLFLHALQSEGVQLYPTSAEINDSLPQDLVRGPAKQNWTSFKSNSIEAIILGQNSSSWDQAYFAGHQTPSAALTEHYYGLHATMDVYGHELKAGQLSSTAFWIIHDGDGTTSSRNSIQVGWHINPEHYGDSRTHFFTSWTRDGHETTGCINMDCPGFIRENGAIIAPGDAINPVSKVPDGPRKIITLRVNKDKDTGDWWVYFGFNNVPTGIRYFPKSLFGYLGEKATRMGFGAYVRSKKAFPTPPMGNGFLPNGSTHAATFFDLRLIDEEGNSIPILIYLSTTITDEKCHSITSIEHGGCFYGGPGGCIR